MRSERTWEVEESLGGSSLENGVRKRLATVNRAMLGLCQKRVDDFGACLQSQFTAKLLLVNVCQQQQLVKIRAVKGKLMLSFQEFMGLNPHLQYYSGRT